MAATLFATERLSGHNQTPTNAGNSRTVSMLWKRYRNVWIGCGMYSGTDASNYNAITAIDSAKQNFRPVAMF